MHSPQSFDSAESAAIIEAGRQVVKAEAASVAAVAAALDQSFVDAVQLVQSRRGKVITVGSGTSATVARRTAHLLSVSGTPALFLHAMDALHGSVGAIEPDDLVIAFSKGGESDELNQLCALVREQNTQIIAVTEAPTSTFASLATLVCELHTGEGADPGNVLAMGSTLVSGVWADALAQVLMRLAREPWEQTLKRHPAGAVGHRSEVPAELDPIE